MTPTFNQSAEDNRLRDFFIWQLEQVRAPDPEFFGLDDVTFTEAAAIVLPVKQKVKL